MKKPFLPIFGLLMVVVALALGVGVLLGGMAAPGKTAPRLAMTELQVDNLSCGSCVETITEALAAVTGVESVEVSVTSGRGQVTYDPERVDAEAIAATVSAAGYPAHVRNDLSAEKYQVLQAEAHKLAELYVARIGPRLLSREEFDAEVREQMRLAGVADRQEYRGRVIASFWPALQQRVLLLNAAEQNRVVVQEEEVDARLDRLIARHSGFESFIRERYASEENFKRQLKEQMIIQRQIDDHVLKNISGAAARRAEFARWYSELMEGCEVIIYDPELKEVAASAGGTCGGSGGNCCG